MWQSTKNDAIRRVKDILAVTLVGTEESSVDVHPKRGIRRNHTVHRNTAPPSTAIVWPVMNEAPSLARKIAAPTRSPGN
jgi:hypothetical protein